MARVTTRPAKTAGYDGYLIVQIPEPVGADGMHALLQAVGELIGAGSARLILDLSQTTYLSCIGIGALIHVAHLARDAGGELLLTRVASRDRETIALIELQDVLRVVDLQDEDFA